MQKIIITLLFFLTTLSAELIHKYPTQKLIDSKLPIVDIRTPAEWIETGIIKDAIPIMFFNEQGKFDINTFLTQLNKKVDTSKKFAIICRTASRTKMVGEYLSGELNYKVTNLLGGMVYVKAKNLTITPYKYKKSR
ncbi:MAG: rhodanese-like domain-containing protein [Campylobacterota bacterium]|nr:rhodanese-like domain-containing protein [Campylobacterota bacterium]